MSDDLKDKYAVVTCISQFRQRYVVPVEKLQAKNTSMEVRPIEWAEDSVTCEDVKEFSQKYLGEEIIDTFIVDEERLLTLFDRDNDYLSDWTKEKKIEWIHDCWEKPDELFTKP